MHPRWILYLVLSLYFLSCIWIFQKAYQANDHLLIYVLDDAYIHMAIAKHFSQEGIWGVTSYGFTSSSTSLLFTLLLSLSYFLFGVQVKVSLILNILFSVFVIIYVYKLLTKEMGQKNHTALFLILMFVVFTTSLPSLTFVGMEHTMDLFFTLLFSFYAAKLLSKNSVSIGEICCAAILAALLCMSRYEGLFTCFVVCVLFLLRRHFVASLMIGFCAFLPLVIFGFISMHEGWYFLPVSTLLKGTPPSLSKITHTELSKIMIPLVFVFLGGFFYILRSKQKGAWDRLQILLVIFLGSLFLHLPMASLGWFYRYEAYLIGFGIVVIGLAVVEYLPQFHLRQMIKTNPAQGIAWIVMIFIVMAPFMMRAHITLVQTPIAMTNNYQKHYIPSQFIKKYYGTSKDTVAVIDVGCLGFYTEARLLDFYGLATKEVAKARLNKTFHTKMLDELTQANHVKMGMFNETIFQGVDALPASWVKVGEWRYQHFVVDFEFISFFATQEKYEQELIANLKSFSQDLPSDIIQSGKYIQK